MVVEICPKLHGKGHPFTVPLEKIIIVKQGNLSKMRGHIWDFGTLKVTHNLEKL